MATCFDNVISLRGLSCGDASPLSGLYLDMLGINMDFVNDIVQKPYSSGDALFTDKVTFSTKAIVSTITNHFADKFRANTLINGERLGFPQDNLQSVAGAAGSLKGIYVELCNLTSFVDLFVSDISLQTDFTGNVSVLVYDLKQNKLLDTLTCATVAGEVSVTTVNKTYKSNRKELSVIFVYDTTAVNSYKHFLKTGGCSSCGIGNFPQVNSYVKAAGISIPSASTKVLTNVTTEDNTAGMSMNYSLQCNHQDWLCTNINQLALPILYFTAAELMGYALSTSRQNSTTILDLESIETRRKEYEMKYFDTVDALLKKIKLPSDDLCFECNRRSVHTFIAP